jgi:2-C-methyl-D-erythritol 4-phosphate cytidylyltransferase
MKCGYPVSELWERDGAELRVGAIIVGAGSSTRMGGGDKLRLIVGGQAVLWYSIAAFDGHEGVDEVVVVASEANIEAVRGLVIGFGKTRVVLGGMRRRDSVACGLEALEGYDIVVVHDGARPLVTRELIDAAIEGARETGAA